MANSYDLTEDKRNCLREYQKLAQNGLGTASMDHDTLIDTLIGLRNQLWALGESTIRLDILIDKYK
jgi:hypothetical protein